MLPSLPISQLREIYAFIRKLWASLLSTFSSLDELDSSSSVPPGHCILVSADGWKDAGLNIIFSPLLLFASCKVEIFVIKVWEDQEPGNSQELS